jgi:pteridine reductase
MKETNRVALVTGGALRIGAEISRELHRCGYTVLIHYRSSATAATELTRELNSIRVDSAYCFQADLSSFEDIRSLADFAKGISGGVDALVNNASSFYPTKIDQASEDDWNILIDSNLKGPFFLTQLLIGTLEKRKGNVINIVDIHSERPMHNHSIYCIAKAGVAMMTKTLAKDLAPNIRVNGVSPGAILWPEHETNDANKQSILKKIPLNRIGECTDIAKTVAFLIEDSPYITGQIVAVDGGRNLTM